MAQNQPTDEQVQEMRGDLVALVKRWRAAGVHPEVVSGELFLWGCAMLREISPDSYRDTIVNGATHVANGKPGAELAASVHWALSDTSPS